MLEYPISLKLTGRRCLVVGNGREAVDRARSLLATGAVVVLVAPAPGAELAELAGSGAEIRERPFAPNDLDGVWLVVLAEQDAELAEVLRREAEARQIFFCAVDQPRFSSYSHLAIARAGLAFAAIGTHGEAPALARRLRELLDELFGRSGLAGFAERLAELRRRTPSVDRRAVLGKAVAGVRLEGRLIVPRDDGEREP